VTAKNVGVEKGVKNHRSDGGRCYRDMFIPLVMGSRRIFLLRLVFSRKEAADKVYLETVSGMASTKYDKINN